MSFASYIYMAAPRAPLLLPSRPAGAFSRRCLCKAARRAGWAPRGGMPAPHAASPRTPQGATTSSTGKRRSALWLRFSLKAAQRECLFYVEDVSGPRCFQKRRTLAKSAVFAATFMPPKCCHDLSPVRPYVSASCHEMPLPAIACMSDGGRYGNVAMLQA